MADIDVVTFSELIDKLMTANTKLYHILDKSAALSKIPENELTHSQKNEIISLSNQNIVLIKERSRLKTAIDMKLNDAIRSQKTDVLNEVKSYG